MNELGVELRGKTGKEGAAKTRREGAIPAVLYGAGGPARPLAVPEAALQRLLQATGGRLSLLSLNITGQAGEKETAIVKAIQRHPVTEQITHIDFLRVSLEEKLTVEVPVTLEGSAPGVKFGGVLQQAVRQVRVRCLPSEIPQAAVADISAMEIGHVLNVSDLKLPASAELITAPDQAVLSITVVRTEEEETAEAAAPAAAAEGAEAEAPAQPEVIGEKERDERRAKKEENREVREKEKQEIKEQRAKEQK